MKHFSRILMTYINIPFKKIKVAFLAGLAIFIGIVSCYSQGARVTGNGNNSIVPTLSLGNITFSSATTNFHIAIAINGTQITYWFTNGAVGYIAGDTNLIVKYITNSDGSLTANLSVNSTNLTTTIVSLMPSIVEQVTNMPVALQNPASNILWWDFKQTNAVGQNYIYQYYQATNDTVFAGPTNCFQGAILSYDVIASGTQRLWFPSNPAVIFNTNNMWFSNPYYVLFLTNGHIWRDTIQSNIVLEHQSGTKGQ